MHVYQSTVGLKLRYFMSTWPLFRVLNNLRQRGGPIVTNLSRFTAITFRSTFFYLSWVTLKVRKVSPKSIKSAKLPFRIFQLFPHMFLKSRKFTRFKFKCHFKCLIWPLFLTLEVGVCYWDTILLAPTSRRRKKHAIWAR